jgi:hypothetical protein
MQHGLYSGSLLDACGKLIYSAYFNLSLCRDISTNPAPMPSTLLDPSNYIVHTINKSGGPVFCSSSHSAVKSGKISDLTAFLFSYVDVQQRDFNSHKETHPVAFGYRCFDGESTSLRKYTGR